MTEPDLIFDTLWSRVLEAWDDDSTHAALLDYALRTENLPTAAGRYRALKDDPDKGETAKKQLDAIVLTATQLLFSMKTPPRPNVPWAFVGAVALLCALALGWAIPKLFQR